MFWMVWLHGRYGKNMASSALVPQMLELGRSGVIFWRYGNRSLQCTDGCEVVMSRPWQGQLGSVSRKDLHTSQANLQRWSNAM